MGHIPHVQDGITDGICPACLVEYFPEEAQRTLQEGSEVNMGKIVPLPGGEWSAHAALKDAMDSIDPSAKVLVIYDTGELVGHRAANITNAEMLYLVESLKFRLLTEFAL